MNAKEMFEELGYKYKNENGIIRIDNWEKVFTFNINIKQLYSWEKPTVEEVFALKKQMKELGWLDE